ncbi:hypothetical protein ACKWTF_013500 [Chironomus riparius]
MTSDRVQLTQYEIQFDISDLKIHFRTMEIRFCLNNKNNGFAYVRGQLFLKCIANVEGIPYVKRQTSEFVYIRSDEMSNLRLINSSCSSLKLTINIYIIAALTGTIAVNRILMKFLITY